MAQMIGGPLDGREITVGAHRYIVPEIRTPGAVWFEEDEPTPAEVDPLTGVLRMKRNIEYINHIYELGADGNYHYQGT